MNLTDVLQKNQISFAPVVPFHWQKDPYLVLDFTDGNQQLSQRNLMNTADFSEYVFGLIQKKGAIGGVGGYNEHRILYRRSPHFQQLEEPREIHLGIDIWAEPGTAVMVPLAGKIHSLKDNAHFGDYGPTIILEHELEGITFHTLYGHLSRSSLLAKAAGQAVEAGEPLARFGPYPENGDWPPHLHFQIIQDMQGWAGDYPGVCTLSQREAYLANCPDPNVILGIPGLSIQPATA
ncbi:MAG: peptidoglycan DD-metalloendopeptidase family protein [Siphonobacter sp.]